MKFLLAGVMLLGSGKTIGQLQYSIFGGPQITSSSYLINNEKQEQTPKYGFHLGMGLKVPFEGSLYFAPAIFYSRKGYEVKYTQFRYPPDPLAVDNNTTFHTLETAFLLQYDLSTKSNHFYLKGGPTLDFQLFGKEEFNTPDKPVRRNIPFGYEKYGHYSANMLAQFGHEWENGLFIHAQYSHGMASINNSDGGPKIRHRVYSLTIGKFFSNKKIVIDTQNRE